MIAAIQAALAEGAVVVTPNRRLARVLQRAFDVAQRAAGRCAWGTPTIVPYPIWLELLWQAALAAAPDADAPLFLTPAQTAQLWRAIVAADALPLLDRCGAATLAGEAWALLQAWGTGGASWRAWRRSADESDDAAVFARWAEAYFAALQRARALDLALLPDELSRRAGPWVARCPATLLAGFTELTPQQARLNAVLAGAGATLREIDTLPATQGSVRRSVAASPREEVAAALNWAQRQAQHHPGVQIGLVVEDLAARRDEVVAQAYERLDPGALLRGASAQSAAFEVSLGIALSAVPLVVAALDLIALADAPLGAGAAAALLRSPYLPAAAQAWMARGAVERGWLEGGRRQVSLVEAIAALESSSPGLAAQWRNARDARSRAAVGSPREWVDRWRGWLTAAGWPGSRPLDSGEYQAREAWERTLGEFASLGTVSRRLSPAAALDALRTLADQTIFQTEGRGAPIQIMGVLEATGLAFDALWVAGLAADRWPAAPAPNPFLPLHWQRERNLPRASAQRELAFATTLTAGFARAAPEVMFSSAASADDHALAPSALILAYPECAPGDAAPTWAQAIAASARLEHRADDRAPALSEGSVAPGGSRIVSAQSDCPFQAVARHRLQAKPWPPAGVGLSSAERGMLVHAALAAFWVAIRDHTALCALSAAAQAAQIEAAVAQAMAELPAPRWRSVPAVVRTTEAQRLSALIDAWLALERTRAPFAVAEVEAVRSLTLSGLSFGLRLDRIDALAAGGLAILDYKTGRVERPSQWFDARPRTAQLGLYTLAQRAAAPQFAVRVVANAQLRAGAVAASGIAADAAAWPGFATVAAVGPCRDWPALESWWRARLGALATEIAQGHAAVTPRPSPSPCRACGLYAVCRIHSLRHPEDSDGDDA